MTLSQEQTLIQPLYNSLSSSALNEISDCASLQSATCKVGAAVFGSGTDPFTGDITKPAERWSYGMSQMGHAVSPSQMPDAGEAYTSGRAYEALK
jgi:hypothetical protein